MEVMVHVYKNNSVNWDLSGVARLGLKAREWSQFGGKGKYVDLGSSILFEFPGFETRDL